jgi:hypothetical protein
MKKSIMLCLSSLFLSAATLLAQPIINNLTGAPLGTKTMGYDIPGAITPGTAGAAQVWDYSTIPYNASTYYFKSVDYAGLTQAMKDSFPTGNVANEFYMGANLVATQVFKLDAAAFVYLGLNTTVFAVPDTQLVFPFNYQETHAGFTYDAYGTLKTPFGTFNDVVRLRETVANNYKYDYWQFGPNYKLLLEYKVDTATQVVSGQAFYNTEAVTAVNEISKVNDAFAVFPNPAKDQLYFTSLWDGIATLEVSDLLGRVLSKKQINIQKNNQVSIDVAGLQQGVYTMNVFENGTKHSRTFLIQ